MVKTIKEFKSEVKEIRRDINKRGKKASLKLVASWLDRLLISIEGVAPTLDLMQISIEQLSKSGTTLKVKAGKVKVKKVKMKKAKKKVKKTVKREKKKGFWSEMGL